MKPSVCFVAFLVTCAACASEPLKIGVIGLDTFHAIQFTKMFNDTDHPGYVPGGKVIGAYVGGSPDIDVSADRMTKVPEIMTTDFGVNIYESIPELAKNVDAIMITSIDGRKHLPQLRETVGSGCPVFIDKPLSGTLSQAVEIVRLVEKEGIPCFSSSSLRFSPNNPRIHIDDLDSIRAVYSIGPASLEPHHPDLYWYGIHPVEALYTVLGPGCRTVTRIFTEATDVVVGQWQNGRVGILQGNRGHSRGYRVIAYTAEGVFEGGDEHNMESLGREIMEFFKTGKPPVPLMETLEIMAFMEAADESKRRSGAPVHLDTVLREAGMR